MRFTLWFNCDKWAMRMDLAAHYHLDAMFGDPIPPQVRHRVHVLCPLLGRLLCLGSIV